MTLAWGGYANGRIPASALAPVPWAKGHMLERTACQAIIALDVAYQARFGVHITFTDSYRAYQGNPYAQLEIFLQRYTTTYLPGRPTRTFLGRTYWQRPYTASAAVPGTSNHGYARAVDLGGAVNRFGTSEHVWMRANAPAYGWIHPAWAHDGYAGNGSEEPWHWEFPVLTITPVARRVIDARGDTIPNITTLPGPRPLTPLDDDMTAEDSARLVRMEGLLIEARDHAAAAARAAQAAQANAAHAGEVAALAIAAGRDAATLAGHTLDGIGAVRTASVDTRTEARDHLARTLRRLDVLQARLPRVSGARYDRPAAASYQELAATAESRGLGYTSLVPLPTAGAALDPEVVRAAVRSALAGAAGTFTVS